MIVDVTTDFDRLSFLVKDHLLVKVLCRYEKNGGADVWSISSEVKKRHKKNRFCTWRTGCCYLSIFDDDRQKSQRLKPFAPQAELKRSLFNTTSGGVCTCRRASK